MEMWRLRHPQDTKADPEKLLYWFSAEQTLLASGYRDASESWPLLYGAVRCLARCCDGAVMQDFRGFNKQDTQLGRRLANCRWWTSKMANDIYLRIRNYRKQLESAGIDYNAIPKPERVA
jgi:hypothetical protein